MVWLYYHTINEDIWKRMKVIIIELVECLHFHILTRNVLFYYILALRLSCNTFARSEQVYKNKCH